MPDWPARRRTVPLCAALLLAGIWFASPAGPFGPPAVPREAAANPESSPTPGSSPVLATGAAGHVFRPGSRVTENVRALALYSVRDGGLERLLLETPDLEDRAGPVRVEGHVTGVVALCSSEAAIRVAGRRAPGIHPDAHGNLRLGPSGTLLRIQDLPRTALPSPPSGGQPNAGAEPPPAEGGTLPPRIYALFAPVAGDTLSDGPRFAIDLEGPGLSPLSLDIEQTAYPFALCTLGPGPAPGDSRRSVSIRYVGTRPEAYLVGGPALADRLEAVADGIRRVEQAFQLELVDQVNLVDFDSGRNAFTGDRGKGVWLYTRTFWEEPPGALKTIASHETLHKAATRLGYPADPEVRAFFAELSGYDALSLERFWIVTSGELPAPARPERTGQSPFLNFISEWNFLEGETGGHAHSNVEEFCTSFLHSLLFVDRLEGNLKRPVRQGIREERDRPQVLSGEERERVLAEFRKGIDTFLRATPQPPAGAAEPPEFLAAHRLLQDCLRRTEGLEPRGVHAPRPRADSPG